MILTEQFLTKATIFLCFGACSVRPPQIFQVEPKISAVRPVLPDYLSVSYDYVYICFLWNKAHMVVSYNGFEKLCRTENLFQIKILKQQLDSLKKSER